MAPPQLSVGPPQADHMIEDARGQGAAHRLPEAVAVLVDDEVGQLRGAPDSRSGQSPVTSLQPLLM
jgi:hypothetical protein